MTRTEIKSLKKEADLSIRENRRLQAMSMKGTRSRAIASLRAKNTPPEEKTAEELQRCIELLKKEKRNWPGNLKIKIMRSMDMTMRWHR